jgi:hypothetical protein
VVQGGKVNTGSKGRKNTNNRLIMLVGVKGFALFLQSPCTSG